MSLSLVQGFSKSLAMTVISEIGDKTFFAAADADIKSNGGTKSNNKDDDDDLKKKNRPFLTQFFSPIFLKLATIGLAAAENPMGVVVGGIIGQALCQTAAVFGGKSLATQISERFIALSGGILFIIFGVQSFFSTTES
ncbi:hypothetical protein L1987_38857 [Smallanthus sonchifolius]|uniref:Uncharacterized protein n=1 Tax=Smallanthus sonchifolius TaxID=185202 RepID=A0ACB9HK83_9ASTR|nr:hypothetical protein L1987_38857 [Smallanthus sonchifolius]